MTPIYVYWLLESIIQKKFCSSASSIVNEAHIEIFTNQSRCVSVNQAHQMIPKLPIWCYYYILFNPWVFWQLYLIFSNILHMNILWWIVIECDSFRLTAYPSMLNSTVFSSDHIHFSVRQIISLTESTGSLLICSIFGQSDLQFLCSRSSCSILWTSDLLLLSKPKNPNLTSTQGWVWQHNDCANPTI